MLQPNTLKPARGAKHKVKRIGRGNASGHGTSSTRGGKGQTARSGGSRGLARLAFKRQLQSAPKLRGFRSLRVKPVVVYLRDLEKYFEAGATITIVALKEKNLLRQGDAAAKVVGDNTAVTKKFILEGVGATSSVAEKIKAAGGEVK